MKKILFLFLCILSGSCYQRPKDMPSLPVLNIAESDYPTRKIDIHDIADVEYIPLESSDSTLIGISYTYISDKYVVVSDGVYGSNIYFFDHSGKFLWKFDRKGAGPEEFTFLNLVIVDFEAEECYVYDINKKMLLIYSFRGEYKHAISLAGMGKGLDGITVFNSIINYDKDFILGYNSAPVLFLRELPDRPLYYLISKKDGKRYPLDLKVQNGLTNLIYDGKGERIGQLNRYPFMINGDECWVSELSSDTIYSLLNRKLVPIAVQNPSVHSTTPPVTIFPCGFTDYFFVFYVVSLFTDESNPQRPYNESKTLVWNRLKNQLERWELYNSDVISSNNSIHIPVMPYGMTKKNCGIMYYEPEGLMNSYKKGALKGELKEIAPHLREDDNKIVVYIKYDKEKIWKILTE